MSNCRSKNPFTLVTAILLLVIGFNHPIDACTRVLYTGAEDVVLTARTLDWAEDMGTDLWVFPRGMKRDSAAGEKSISWTSKYGSIVASGYDAGSADGMNENGLVANLLYLAESNYGAPTGSKPVLSISTWAQYVLDNFGNVAEAVEALSKETFQIVAPILPNGSPAALHLAISDPSGDSAIFESIDGKQVIHHGKQYTVLTNSPTYDQQLALNSYWEKIGGLVFLPGTSRAADRFARASFFVGAIPKKIDPHYITAVPHKSFVFQAISSVLGVVRSVSVPLGITTPNQPNIASTLWRVVADQKNKVYCYDSATTPNTFWVRMEDLDLREQASPRKLPLKGGEVYSGNVATSFVIATPFTFLPVK